MQFAISYNKNKVIQALRQHFIKQKEIKILIIVVNVFTFIAAILFYSGKIQPQPFFLGTIIWLLVLIGIWYVLPYNIYSKTDMFKNEFIAFLNNRNLFLETEKGNASFEWNKFNNWFETENFYHLYLTNKSFLLLPKENLKIDEMVEINNILNQHITRK